MIIPQETAVTHRKPIEDTFLTYPKDATPDLEGKENLFAALDGNGKVVIAGLGERTIGVIANTPYNSADDSAWEQATKIIRLGRWTVVAGENLEQGDRVMPDADGKAVKHIAGYAVAGTVEYDASTDDVVAVWLNGDQAQGTTPQVYQFPLSLVDVTGAGDIVTDWTPGFAGTITKIEFITGTPVTTAGDAMDINLDISDTDVTGGVVSLTSAAATPLGAIIAGTAITADNVFNSTDTISIEATNVTPFAEGSGVIQVTVLV